MKTLLKFQILLAIMAGILSPAASTQAYTGVISVDTVEANPAGHIAVPVRLSNNNEPISGLIVPLKFTSSYLTVDSVSFAGSILPPDFDAHVVVDSFARKIKISYIAGFVNPIPTLSASSGLIGTIFLSVSAAASPGTMISIDSVNIDSIANDGGPAAHIWEKVQVSNDTGIIALVPSFVAGGVSVKSATGIDDNIGPSGLPTSFALSQNYPNPFNPSTVIEFALPRAGRVQLQVFNILGQEVTTLIDRNLPAGNHRVEFNATDLPSGIYFYRLSHTEGKLTRKMALLK